MKKFSNTLNTVNRELFIHVGPHKTGTTSIQEILLDRTKEIEKAGGAVFLEIDRKHRKRANAWELAHCFVRNELQTPMRLSMPAADSGSEECMGRIDRFRRWLAETNAQTIIVSSEAFSFLRTDGEARALSAALEGFFGRVTPVVVFRPLEQRRRSWQKQLVEMGVAKRVANLDDRIRVDGEWYFDWTSLTDFWSLFGEVITIDYQHAVDTSGSIIPAFQEAVGLKEFSDATDYFLNVTDARKSGLAHRLRRKILGW